MSANTLLPAYLLVGPDELKAQTTMKRLKKYLHPDFAAFNFDELFVTSELDEATVISSLNMYPLGEGPRIVILHDADLLTSQNKQLKTALINYLKEPNVECTLLLAAKSMRTNDTLYKAVSGLGKNAIISCDLKKDYQMPAEVAQMAQKLGLIIDDSAAQELARRVGIDRKLIDQSLRMLYALHPGSACITLEDVKKEVAITAALKPWDLPDAISQKNAVRALEYLHRTDSRYLYSSITNISDRLRQLLSLKGLKNRGQASQAATILGLNPYVAKNLASYSNNFSEKQLIESLDLCLEKQKKILQGSDTLEVLRELILEICSK